MIKFNSKKAKFFCENCGREVKQDARVCNFCGKFFSSVKCPKCGISGHSDEFSKGCPACGYAVNPKELIAYNTQNTQNIKNGNKYNNFKKDHFYITKPKIINNKKKQNSESLPFWVYCVCISVLMIIILCLYSC